MNKRCEEHKLYLQAQHVQENVFKTFKNKTVISTIHRLHLLPLFDTIYIFEKGKMIESGTYTELLGSKRFQRMLKKYDTKIRPLIIREYCPYCLKEIEDTYEECSGCHAHLVYCDGGAYCALCESTYYYTDDISIEVFETR